jgi:hypothetical protein
MTRRRLARGLRLPEQRLRRDVRADQATNSVRGVRRMTGYYSNLALHISDATLKGHRRLSVEQRMHWGHIAFGMAGAATAWLAAIALF